MLTFSKKEKIAFLISSVVFLILSFLTNVLGLFNEANILILFALCGVFINIIPAFIIVSKKIPLIPTLIVSMLFTVGMYLFLFFGFENSNIRLIFYAGFLISISYLIYTYTSTGNTKLGEFYNSNVSKMIIVCALAYLLSLVGCLSMQSLKYPLFIGLIIYIMFIGVAILCYLLMRKKEGKSLFRFILIVFAMFACLSIESFIFTIPSDIKILVVAIANLSAIFLFVYTLIELLSKDGIYNKPITSVLFIAPYLATLFVFYCLVIEVLDNLMS